MVVNLLEYYMENEVPGGFDKVSLPELIKKKQETDPNPILVLDASSVSSKFHDNITNIFNGQLKEFQENIKKFIDKIQSLGAQLVVFYPGTTEYEVLEKWKYKRIRHLKDLEKQFENLKKNIPVEKFSVQLAPAHVVGKNTFITSGCKVYTSVKECDEEVVEFICSNKCLAVLGQDSDYVIYDVPYYISVKSVNLNTLECNVYDRNKLAEHLDLELNELPLLATLLGNELINPYFLKKFHSKFVSKERFDRDKLMKGLAKYIRDKRSVQGIYGNLRFIAVDIYHRDVNAQTLQESIEMYVKGKCKKQKDQKSRILEFAENQKKNNLLSPTVCQIMEKNIFRSNNDVEDFTDATMQPAARILRPLRRRLYGVILHNSDNKIVFESCVEGCKSERTNDYVIDQVELEALEPRVEHPGLERLWLDKTEETKEMKWNLFCDVVSSKLKPEFLKNLPVELLIPVTAIFYLKNELRSQFFEKNFEYESLLITAMKTKKLQIDDIRKIEISQPDLRALQISSKYLRCASVIEFLNQAVGHVFVELEACPSKWFDGKLFQSYYLRMRSGEIWEDFFTGNTEDKNLFLKIRKIVNNDS